MTVRDGWDIDWRSGDGSPGLLWGIKSFTSQPCSGGETSLKTMMSGMWDNDGV